VIASWLVLLLLTYSAHGNQMVLSSTALPPHYPMLHPPFLSIL
jgi:hypothetical protein